MDTDVQGEGDVENHSWWRLCINCKGITFGSYTGIMKYVGRLGRIKEKAGLAYFNIVLPAFAASSADVANGLSHTYFFLCAPQACHGATFTFTAAFF
jgi:hypothetical protein